jgi:hypothetical protein
MNHYTTTLKVLQDNHACKRGYDLIAKHVGENFEGEFSLEKILDNNGLDDCIWSLRCVEGGKELATSFAIICATRVYTEPTFIEWARNWMSGEDRTDESAKVAAANTARAAAYAANTARAAAYAARAAAYAAYAANAANAAAYAARAAAYAANAASAANAAARKWQGETLRKLIRNEYTGE